MPRPYNAAFTLAVAVTLPAPSCAASLLLFFFNDTATTEIYTLSLHDALPIWPLTIAWRWAPPGLLVRPEAAVAVAAADRKSIRLNSSHEWISYAVFCLKKKKSRNPQRLIR